MVEVSVIIPTYNGAHKLPNILNALKSQTFKNFEVMIVIDGSTDNTTEVLRTLNLPFISCKVIEQENKGRAAVRNVGALEAKGELLVFFDDDMRPSSSCLEEHLKQHQATRSDMLLVGSQLEEAKAMKTDIQKYKAVLSEKWLEPYKSLKSPLNKNNIFITAANLSLSRKLFLALGGFDERLTDAEDYDLGIRALEKHVPVYFHYPALSWHDDFITMAGYIKRQKQYKAAHEKLLELKPELYKKDALEYKTMDNFLKQTIYKIFKSQFWVDLVDKHNWLILLPKPLRFKLYDIVIYSNSQL